MGVFTIYDWGNGAAAEAAVRTLDRFGHVYVDRDRGRAFGIDQVRIRPVTRGWEIINEGPQPRTLRVVYEGGGSREVRIVRVEKSFVIR